MIKWKTIIINYHLIIKIENKDKIKNNKKKKWFKIHYQCNYCMIKNNML